MRGCFQNIEQAVDYIKYIALDNFNVSVKLYREGGCWYVDEETAAPPKPNNLTVEQASLLGVDGHRKLRDANIEIPWPELSTEEQAVVDENYEKLYKMLGEEDGRI